MVKIHEIDGLLDAEEDDDCCEIDLAEFAKKVNLKTADDDVVVVAAKGPIKAKGIRKPKVKVKVEADQPGDCSDTNGNQHERAAGDCLENPYEIEEDETTVQQTESDAAKPGVKFDIKSLVKCESEDVADLLPVKCEPDEGNSADELFEQVIPGMSPVKCESEGFEEVVADMSPVKCEPGDGNGADEHFEEVTTDVSLLKFGSLCFEEFISDKQPVKSAPQDGNGADEHFTDDIEEVIADMPPVKFEPEEGNNADELFKQVILGMSPVKCKSESFEEVVADVSPVKCEHEDGSGADERFEEVTPDLSPLKCGSECFEEVIPDMSTVKLGPEDGNGANECAEEEEDAYDHLPEMDMGGRVFDEEDNDDFVVVGREVALRDYPHPRHLCANFPLYTTSHENRCRKCYCSLCEVPASSCLEWKGTEGHCHATK